MAESTQIRDPVGMASARGAAPVVTGVLVSMIAVGLAVVVATQTQGAVRWPIVAVAGVTLLAAVGMVVGRSRVLAGLSAVLVPATLTAASYADTGPAHGKGGVTDLEFVLYVALAGGTLLALPAFVLCVIYAVRGRR